MHPIGHRQLYCGPELERLQRGPRRRRPQRPDGRRLGRGGGFYDRFLARTRDSAVRVGIAFDRQVIDEIPTQDHDVMVDIVITERRITNAKPLRSA